MSTGAALGCGIKCRAEKAFERVGDPELMARLARALERHVSKCNAEPPRPALALAANQSGQFFRFSPFRIPAEE